MIGDSPDNGVIDPYHRLYGHPGLHVVDGAAVSANLGVNPARTITAQAERAMSFWPNRDVLDPRPPLSAPYERVAPVGLDASDSENAPGHSGCQGKGPELLRQVQTSAVSWCASRARCSSQAGRTSSNRALAMAARKVVPADGASV